MLDTTKLPAAADQTAIMLNLLANEIERVVVRDPGSEMARNVATVATRLLQRALIDRTIVPNLRKDAVAGYRALLPKLQGLLASDLYDWLSGVLKNGETVEWATLERVLNEVGPALLAKGEAESGRLAGQLFAIDAALREAKEKAWQDRSKPDADDATPAVPIGLNDQQQARLLDFIKQRFPDETTLRIAKVKQIPGGFSKLTMFIHLEGNKELPDALVMRWDGPYASFGTSVTMEFPIIERLHAHGVAVPQPYASESSGTVLDRPFILIGHAPGRTTGDFVVVNEPSREVALDLARQLARMHSVPIDGLEQLLPNGTALPRERLTAMLATFEAAWNGLEDRNGFAVTSALSWLRSNLDLADGPRAIIHNDLGPHNYLVHEDRISAILDWETGDIGTPLEDVGGLYYHMSQMIDWQDFVQLYERESGTVIDRRQLDFFIVWGAVRMATLVNAYIDPVFTGKRESLSEYYLGDYIAQVMIERVASRMAAIFA